MRKMRDVRSSLSSRVPADPAPVAASTTGEAYREGRIDERRGETLSRRERRARARAAAPRRRRGAPLLAFVILLVVAFGAIMLYLAARNGSFANAGAVIDRDLSSATQPVRRAEDRTGQALETAGQRLKRQSGAPDSSGAPNP
jgi:hypothetical protein